MSLEINSVTESYAGYTQTTAKTASASPEEVTQNNDGAVYEKSSETKNATYTVNKMSAEDRAALVSQLKAEQEARQNQLKDLVSQMLGKQASTFADANDMWSLLAKGDYTVSPEVKAQAQADIAEDGYWGVKQTSQRLFDFASALAGDDVDKMKEMQEAMMKGYEKATKAWGKELPSISKDTIDAANKLFDDYYASMGVQQ